MPGTGGSRVIQGVGFWAQQPIFLAAGPVGNQVWERAPLWPNPAAKPFDPPNLLLTTLAPPPVVDNTKIFRPPIFARLPDRLPIARQEYVANLLPFQSMAPTGVPAPPTVDQPIGGIRNPAKPFDPPNLLLSTLQPMAPVLVPLPPTVDQPSGGARPKAIVDPVVRIAPLLTPNPAQPFTQLDWPRAVDGKPKAVGEPIGRVAALLTPNPAQPFTQLDWYRIAPTQRAKVDDALNLTPFLPAPIVTVRFSQLDWPRPASPPAVAKPTDQQNLLTSTLAPPVVVDHSKIFRSPLIARLPDAWPKAKVDDPGNLTIGLPVVVVTVAFKQLDWPNAALPRIKQADASVAASAPLYSPNPAQPFAQSDWFQIRTTAKAKVDDVVNLLPTQTGVVVIQNPFSQNDWLNAAARPVKITDTSIAAPAPLYSPNPAQPFNQDLWDLAIKALPKVTGEAVGTLSPLLTPNPAKPFAQSIWDSATPAKPKAYAEPVAAISALYNPNPARPFNQNLWEGAAKAAPKAIGEALAPPAPILTPNPAQPFNQTDWPKAAPQRAKASVDDFVNLSRGTGIIVPPFFQNDWSTVAAPRSKITDTSVAISLPIYFPNPARPFSQGDWTRVLTRSAAKVDDVINLLPLHTFVPPPPPTGIHAKPLLATPGRMLSIPGDNLPG